MIRKLLGENERTSVKLTVSDKYKDTDNVKASKKMFEYAGVKLTHFESDKKLTIDFNVNTI